MQRIRDNKATQGGNGGGRGSQKQSAGPKPANGGRSGNGTGARQGQGQGQGRHGGGGGRPPQHQRFEDGEVQPRMGAHQSGSPFVLREAAPVRKGGGDGQPDPLRTSVDSMGGRGRRGGGGGGGGRGFGGGGGGSRSGGSRNWGR